MKKMRIVSVAPTDVATVLSKKKRASLSSLLLNSLPRFGGRSLLGGEETSRR